MNEIDLVLAVLVVGVSVLEMKRGFGKAVFDLTALLIDLKVVSFLAPPLAAAVHLSKDAPASEAMWFAGLFVVVGAILLFLGKMAYNSTLISLDSFDPILGGVLGLAVALIVGHTIVKTLATAAGVGGVPPEVLRQSTLGMEFYSFSIYHTVLQFLSSLGS